MSAKAGYCDINCTNTNVDHKHNYYWVDSANVYVGAMNNGIANIALQDAMNGSLNIEVVIGKLKLGEVMGKTFEGGKWYDNGTEIVYDNLKGTNKIIYNLYDTLLSDIMNGNFNIDSALNSLYVGELMNYEGGVGSWTKLVGGSYQSVSKIEGIIADIKMSDLLSGNVDFKTKINDLNLSDVVDVNSSSVLKLLSGTPIKDIPTAVDSLYIGHIMGYVECTNDDSSCPINVAGHVHDGKWYDASGNVVKGVYATISKYTIKGLTEGGLTNVKIGELIDTEGNAVLSLLANETLSTVGAKTNSLKLGEIMGYVKCTNDDASCPVTKLGHVHNGKWFDKSGNEVTGINQKMAGFTIQDVSDGKLGGSEFVNSLTVGDVITSNTGVFKIMEIGAFTVGEGSSAVSYNAVGSVSEVPVSEISARVTEGVKNAKYAELKDAGINILSAENENNISLFYLHKDKGVTDWQNKTIDEIISDILTTALPTT